MTDLRKYLRSKGCERVIQGSCYRVDKQKELLKQLTHNKKTGLEIGLNAGDSAYLFLTNIMETFLLSQAIAQLLFHN